MLSKNSVVSEVGGVCESDDLFFSCFRGQLLGAGGEMVLSNARYANLGGGPSRRVAMVLRF
jgi:hypothetical protein